MYEKHSTGAARLLDGNEVNAAILDSVRDAIEAHVSSGGQQPGG